MYFFTFLAKPKPGSGYAEKYGGAYANCWIKNTRHEKAEEVARHLIESFGWTVIAMEEYRAVSEDDYPESAEGLEYYRKAEKEGSCCVMHTYPPDAA